MADPSLPGYIAEDEEATCGLLGDWRWFGGYAGGISIGCEGSNGMLSAVGPVPGTMHVLDYYWHGSQGPDLGTWNRIISGTAQVCTLFPSPLDTIAV
eukprot:m.804812 g.804812  ORF g.804812 m.804812 type:complete len:97 (-) comp23369_c0_seq4:187-477(-)